MYTSVIENGPRRMAGTAFVYLIISLFIALFGAVYESFSHEVYSFHMIYAFAIPLAGGALPFFALALSYWTLPRKVPLNLYHSGIAALTVGCIFKGVLEIYGTTNSLVRVYWVVGAVFIILSLIMWIFQYIKNALGCP